MFTNHRLAMLEKLTGSDDWAWNDGYAGGQALSWVFRDDSLGARVCTEREISVVIAERHGHETSELGKNLPSEISFAYLTGNQ